MALTTEIILEPGKPAAFLASSEGEGRFYCAGFAYVFDALTKQLGLADWADRIMDEVVEYRRRARWHSAREVLPGREQLLPHLEANDAEGRERIFAKGAATTRFGGICAPPSRSFAKR